MTELLVRDDSQHANTEAIGGKLIIIGIIKDTTASSVQFSVSHLGNWFAIPTVFIEDATCLGLVQSTEPSQKAYLPVFSISLKGPETQSEQFLFNLIMPPLFTALKNAQQVEALN